MEFKIIAITFSSLLWWNTESKKRENNEIPEFSFPMLRIQRLGETEPKLFWSLVSALERCQFTKMFVIFLFLSLQKKIKNKNTTKVTSQGIFFAIKTSLITFLFKRYFILKAEKFVRQYFYNYKFGWHHFYCQSKWIKTNS